MYISDTKVYYDKLIEHDLSLLEYCVADYIYKLSETAGNKKDGYCYMSKENLAKAFMVTERTIYRITKRLVAKSIIVKSGESYLKTINWDTKGNYYFIRHQLIAELKKDKSVKAYDKEKDCGLDLSLEEYAIMDIALNNKKIKQNEIQKRIHCSKRSISNYMKKINRCPSVGYLNGVFYIKDLYMKHYFDTDTKKILDEQQQRYGDFAELLFDENGNEIPQNG